MYEAFYFGPEERQLFGVYHPSMGGDRRVLTLVCPPLFSEQMRAHAALRKLSIALSDIGHHVLRFDYVGTGDSFGNLTNVSLADWETDIATALQEGRELSGCEKVRVLGVRGSCPLVCRSVGNQTVVDRLVFWDPIRDGRQYLDVLRRGQLESIQFHVLMNRAYRKKIESSYCVYEMSESMKGDFLELSQATYSSATSEKMSVVTTVPPGGNSVGEVRTEFVDFDCDWDTESEEVIMCQPVLETLIKCLCD